MDTLFTEVIKETTTGIPQIKDTTITDSTPATSVTEESISDDTASTSVAEESIPDDTASTSVTEELISDVSATTSVTEEFISDDTATTSVTEEFISDVITETSLSEESIPDDTAATSGAEEEITDVSAEIPLSDQITDEPRSRPQRQTPELFQRTRRAVSPPGDYEITGDTPEDQAKSVIAPMKHHLAQIEEIYPFFRQRVTAVNDQLKKIGYSMLTEKSERKRRQSEWKQEIYEERKRKLLDILADLRLTRDNLKDAAARLRKESTLHENHPLMKILDERLAKIKKRHKKFTQVFDQEVESDRLQGLALTNAELTHALMAERDLLRKGLKGAAMMGMGRLPILRWSGTSRRIRINAEKKEAMKARGAGLVAQLGPQLARQTFGCDLIEEWINVPNEEVILSQEDRQAAEELALEYNNVVKEDWRKINLDKLPYHIPSGVCSGAMMDLCIQVLERWSEEDWKTPILNGGPQGATSAAAANQAVYQSIPLGSSGFEEHINTLFKPLFADNKKGARAEFDADFHAVGRILVRLFTDLPHIRGLDLDENPTPFEKIVHTYWLEHRHEVRGLDETYGTYIKDPKKFEQKMLSQIGELDGEEKRIAKETLKWTLAFAEDWVAFHSGFTTLNDGYKPRRRQRVKWESGYSNLSLIKDKNIRRLLRKIESEKLDTNRMNKVAILRGVELISMESVVGQGQLVKNDHEVFSRMNDLSDGAYLLCFDTGDGAHTISYIKKGDESYLCDPNFGVIKCQSGRAGEQLGKLLNPTGVAGYSEPEEKRKVVRGGLEETNHHIAVFKVTPLATQE